MALDIVLLFGKDKKMLETGEYIHPFLVVLA